MFLFRQRTASESDEELLRRYLRSGETEYFGILYDRYIPLVYGVCLKYLRSAEDAEDAVMQLFEELTVKVRQYEIDRFRTWLYSVVRNHCLQLLRREEREIPVDWAAFPADSDEFLDLLGEEGDEEQLRALHHCLDRLPEEQRISIRAFFLAQKSYAEIADETGYVLKSVKSYIQNGKRNLKLCIEKTTKEWGYCPI
ncbi:MAG: sigma-70 family RNA polymerase sigma factor [Coprobacter sp.]|nr:sigma-70 family RNA polymerase sigma factor [Coprobacter sp.]